MRKQGIMKRVLGGIMAVAFGAALCFAAPVKAEAATPWDVDTRNMGEWLADYYTGEAEGYGLAAQRNVLRMQYYLGEQIGAQVNIAQTTAATQQHLAMLGVARQAASMIPQPYAGYVINEINWNYGALRDEAIGFINGELAYAADMAKNVELQRYYMQNNLKTQQVYMAGAQAAALAGAVDRQLSAQQDALSAMYRNLGDQIDAAYLNVLVAMGRGGYNYGF